MEIHLEERREGGREGGVGEGLAFALSMTMKEK